MTTETLGSALPETVALQAPAPGGPGISARWTSSAKDAKSSDMGLGIHVADLSAQSVIDGQKVDFTFYWPDAGRWEGADFIVRIGA
jgi:glucoamylase